MRGDWTIRILSKLIVKQLIICYWTLLVQNLTIYVFFAMGTRVEQSDIDVSLLLFVQLQKNWSELNNWIVIDELHEFIDPYKVIFVILFLTLDYKWKVVGISFENFSLNTFQRHNVSIRNSINSLDLWYWYILKLYFKL